MTALRQLRRPSLRLLLGCVAVLASSSVEPVEVCRPQPQQVRFERLSITEGLPHGVVFDILQDPTGFMWFGTKEGLGRWDGLHWKVWREDSEASSSLSQEDISSLMVGENGRIWIGTWGGGLDVLDPVTGTIEHHRPDPARGNTLHDGRVQCLLQYRSAVWVGTFQGGLSRFDTATGSFTTYRHGSPGSSSIPSDRVWWMAAADHNRIWVATDQGLARFHVDGETFEVFHHVPEDPDSLSHDVVRTLYRDRTGTLWLGAERGLNRVVDERSALRFERIGDGLLGGELLREATVNVMVEDAEGSFWIGTNDSGLLRFDVADGRVEQLIHDPAVPSSLANDDVRSLLVDRSDLLWIGTRGGGVSRLDLKPKKFDRIVPLAGNPRSLRDPRVRVLCGGRCRAPVGGDRRRTEPLRWRRLQSLRT